MVAISILVVTLANSERANTLTIGTKLRAMIMIDYLIPRDDYHVAASIKDDIAKLMHEYSKNNDNVVVTEEKLEDGSVERKKAVQFILKDRRGERQPDIKEIRFHLAGYPAHN